MWELVPGQDDGPRFAVQSDGWEVSEQGDFFAIKTLVQPDTKIRHLSPA